MKSVVIVLFTVFAFQGFAQQWVDSLKVARTAYKNKEYDKALELVQLKLKPKQN